MPRPNRGGAGKPPRAVPWKWVGLGVLVLAALALHQIPWPMDVTLHLTTEQMSFSLGETGETAFMKGLALTSLTVRGLPEFRVEVDELREGGKDLVPGGGRVALVATGRDSTLAMRGDSLRLMELTLAPGTRVTLYADRAGQAILEVKQAGASRMELGMLGGLSLTAKDLILNDPRDREIPFAGTGPVHHLEARLPSRNLILEPGGEAHFSLTLDLSEQLRQSREGELPLAIAPRLKVASLDFTRKEGTRQVPAIRRLWVDPLVPENKPREAVFLDISADTVFTLQSVKLSGDALACELTGRTDTLRVGKDSPRENLVPSLLQYLANHVVFRTVCKPLGIC